MQGLLSSLTGMIAAAPAGPAPGSLQQLIGSFGPFILIFVILYLLMIRPQQKRRGSIGN